MNLKIRTFYMVKHAVVEFNPPVIYKYCTDYSTVEHLRSEIRRRKQHGVRTFDDIENGVRINYNEMDQPHSQEITLEPNDANVAAENSDTGISDRNTVPSNPRHWK